MLCLSVKTVFEPCLTFMKFASQLFSGADESLKERNTSATARRWFASDTAHTLCSSIYMYIYGIWYSSLKDSLE